MVAVNLVPSRRCRLLLTIGEWTAGTMESADGRTFSHFVDGKVDNRTLRFYHRERPTLL